MQPSQSVLAIQGRIIVALLLRDIRTRFFGNGLGYIVAILWPFIHIGVLLIIYTLTGRTSPLGGNTVVYLAIGVLPVICFMYMSRFIMYSVQTNQPLLNFPIVKFVDIIVARVILEAAAACCVAVIMAATLFGLDMAVMPAHPGQAAMAFFANLILGTGVGAINGVIVLKMPGWAVVYILFGIILYVTSGIVFVPEAFPEEIRSILAWNPLLHIVEWMRESYFDGFKSLVLDKNYPILVGGITLFLSLGIERGFRRYLRR